MKRFLSLFYAVFAAIAVLAVFPVFSVQAQMLTGPSEAETLVTEPVELPEQKTDLAEPAAQPVQPEPMEVPVAAVPKEVAQTPPASTPLAKVKGKKQPLEISAEQTLEWHRKDLMFFARGKAVAKQGDTIIYADSLRADYDQQGGDGFDIHTLTATGNVVITSPGHKVFGEKAVYDVRGQLAVMTGNNLRLEGEGQVITARDRFEYQTRDGRLSAVGQVKVVRGADVLTSDRMSAYFEKDAQGKNSLKSVTAKGNLVIKTATETLYGDRGEYLAATQMATVYDNVRIVRGPNTLEGDKAEVDLRTDVSRIFGGAPSSGGQGSGRVRGVFYPDSEDSNPLSPQ